MKYIKEKKNHKETPEKTVAYEYSMLNESLKRMKASKASGNGAGESLNLESFLLHATNLIDFLKGNIHDGKLSVKDFKDKEGKTIQSIELDFDKDFIKKIHDHCRHISKNRLKRGYIWYPWQIRNEIVRGMDIFYALKSSEEIG